MSDPETNISKARALKEEGNVHFKAGEYKKAMASYHQIFLHVHGFGSAASMGGMAGAAKSMTPLTAEQQAAIHELKLAHHSNLAMCHLKIATPESYEKARQQCTKALAIDGENVKALFRRGRCNLELGDLDAAGEDLKAVLQREPSNRDALLEQRKLRGLNASQRAKEKNKFKGFFEKLSKERGDESDGTEDTDEAEGGGASAGASAGASGGASAGASAGASGGASGEEDAFAPPVPQPISATVADDGDSDGDSDDERVVETERAGAGPQRFEPRSVGFN